MDGNTRITTSRTVTTTAQPTLAARLFGWTVGCCIATAVIMGTIKLGMVLFG